ncbi:ethanolamine utilization protein EutJ family protein [Desulfosporosinus acidiphilus SJ4]|uniref:Ethanolamine utilization protein EutJ family protein n=1 Tax=Desulfosporosinus acidiphilus (strain DSM 22704 / JCM 16185 / SJ4) TaxID=646529 RepID=I4D455_DESAJ|nr:ethanolamine utilization protein EutJ [Desulfosporosinus acidiphilus]AFM40579.1 ethanolamine utilization protein EutJ family protein [Desulfosporosinus acidiphilus SJ4]
MNTVNSAFQYCDQLVQDFEKVIVQPIVKPSSVYYTGIDLGTAYIVLTVLDERYQPVAGAYRFANVVKDGMVVDYIGAIRIVKELKQELEEKLGTELLFASAALPPGTFTLDSGAIKHVVQGAGFEITKLLDEPTAANAVLKIKNGAIVDIGGGTTGIAILKDGEVIYVADEPTGGTHFSLVIAGACKMSFEEAEQYKRNSQNHRELTPVLRPVIEKVSSIISRHVQDYSVPEIYLVGGTCCLEGIETIIAKQTNLPTFKPRNPMFVTPLGIAMNCTQEIL